MIVHEDYDGFRNYKTPEKRRYIYLLYLFVFGMLLGVLLTNTYTMYVKKTPARDSSPAGETAVKNQTAPAIQTGTEAIGAPDIPAGTAQRLTDYELAVVAAARKAKPAVVSIYIRGTQVYRFRNPVYDMLYGPVVKELTAMGSGVIVHPDGTVITNEHVIRDIKNTREPVISVVLSDGRVFEAKLVKDLPGQDIAILSIEGDNLPHVEFGSSDTVMQGQTVLAIGNPFGLSTGGEPTITRGIISATKRNLTLNDGAERKYYRDMLQTDASINEGNSGGALVDLNGNLIGINTAIYSEGAGSIGIGFAIPVNRIRLILDNIEKNGEIAAVETGIRVQSMNAAIAGALDFSGQGGIIVSEVAPGSPGEKAGLEKGDIITQINGFNIQDINHARSLFRDALPGEIYTLRVFHSGKYDDLKLKLEPRG